MKHMLGCASAVYTCFLVVLVFWLPSQFPPPWGAVVYAAMALWVAILIVALIGNYFTNTRRKHNGGH